MGLGAASLAAIPLVAACGSDSDPADANAPGQGASATAEPVDPDRQFLLDNAARDGVTVTESGLQYEVLRPADGLAYGEEGVGAIPSGATLVFEVEPLEIGSA